VKADSPSTVIIVVNAIIKSESLSGVQQKITAEKLLQKIQVNSWHYDLTPYT
jgi:exosome complex component RRP40